MLSKQIKSILPLLVSIILFFVVGKFGIGKISEVRSEISKVSKDKTTLTEKLAVLNTIAAEAEAGSQITSIALPEKNSSLTVFSQIKQLATDNQVILTNIKSGGGAQATSGLTSANVTFEASGPKEGILAFLISVEKIAPLTLADKVKLNESGGTSRATINLRTFYAGYPTKLPTITQPISALTADDRNILIKLSELTLPKFSQIPEAAGGKTDPFAQ